MNEPTANKLQWNSPLLLGGLVIVILLVAAAATMFLVKSGGKRLPKDEIALKDYPTGVPINEQRVASEFESLSAANPENNLLVTSSLRTTYTGFLVNIEQPAANQPEDIALVLDLIQPDGGQGARFEFTLAELGIIRWFIVSRQGTMEFSLDQLEPNYGLSITRVTNLMSDANPDEIVIEVTRQVYQ